MKKFAPTLLFALMAITTTAAIAAPPAPAAVPVRSQAVAEHRLTPTLNVVGNLAAERALLVSPQISGKIAEILVDSNQQVAAGQLLVRIEDASVKAAVAEAKAYLLDEQRKLAELKRLIKQGAVTQSEIDAQAASVAMADARLQGAQAELDYHHLKAPFAGTVGLIDYSIGTLVNNGSELMSLDDLTTLRLDLSVPEHYLPQLATGLKVLATSKSWPDSQFVGEVIAIDPRVSEASLNLKVRVRFDNASQQLKPGMMMAATITFADLAKPVVPIQALEYSGTKRYVYVIDDSGVAHRTLVTLGQRVGTQVAIESGVEIGQRIVVEGTVNMKDGQSVQDLAQQPAQGVATNAAL